MTLDEFRASLALDAPPAELSAPLAALWRQARGDWHGAHEQVQADEGDSAAWVHAHLHRVEGDLSNAAYWYRRAGQPTCEDELQAEWTAITDALLNATS